MQEVKVPDIGDFKDVPVIEIHFKEGDTVAAEDSLVTLESDKATLDVPAPQAGVIRAVKVALGDKVSEGSVIVLLEAATNQAASQTSEPLAATPASVTTAVPAPERPSAVAATPAVAAPASTATADIRPTEAEPTTAPLALPIPTPQEITLAVDGAQAYASPSVRKFARELGVVIDKVTGSGPKGRILHSDVQTYVKAALSGMENAASGQTGAPQATHTGGLNLLPWPQVDFAKFGPVERKPLSRIKKISGPNLARNWVMIPAVTYHEDADITELEALRVTINKEQEKAGVKVTMLAFLIKAAVAALKKYPELNASLLDDDLVYKNYWHIGFAADTPNGLMVPVLKNADQKGILEISEALADLSKKARDGKLGPAEMQGATFTISSLGGIGGTYFSPIVNAPEVAILGVNKAALKPVWDGRQFAPRLILPLSLSADHRVIDGALATRFNAYLATLLGDFRRAML